MDTTQRELKGEVKQLFEVNNLTPLEIADTLGWEEEDVVSALLAVSSKFRVESKKFLGDKDLDTLYRHARTLALASENEAVQARMTEYLIDDLRGRRDKDTADQNAKITINLINQQLKAAQTNPVLEAEVVSDTSD